MAIDPSLAGLRHESDLASTLSTDALWPRTADGGGGTLTRMLGYLIDARRQNPPAQGDGAFRTVPDAIGACGGECTEERQALSVLAQLEAAALVERVGGRVNAQRWRATSHALLTESATRIRLQDAA